MRMSQGEKRCKLQNWRLNLDDRAILLDLDLDLDLN